MRNLMENRERSMLTIGTSRVFEKLWSKALAADRRSG